MDRAVDRNRPASMAAITIRLTWLIIMVIVMKACWSKTLDLKNERKIPLCVWPRKCETCLWWCPPDFQASWRALKNLVCRDETADFGGDGEWWKFRLMARIRKQKALGDQNETRRGNYETRNRQIKILIVKHYSNYLQFCGWIVRLWQARRSFGRWWAARLPNYQKNRKT